MRGFLLGFVSLGLACSAQAQRAYIRANADRIEPLLRQCRAVVHLTECPNKEELLSNLVLSRVTDYSVDGPWIQLSTIGASARFIHGRLVELSLSLDWERKLKLVKSVDTSAMDRAAERLAGLYQRPGWRHVLVPSNVNTTTFRAKWQSEGFPSLRLPSSFEVRFDPEFGHLAHFRYAMTWVDFPGPADLTPVKYDEAELTLAALRTYEATAPVPAAMMTPTWTLMRLPSSPTPPGTPSTILRDFLRSDDFARGAQHESIAVFSVNFFSLDHYVYFQDVCLEPGTNRPLRVTEMDLPGGSELPTMQKIPVEGWRTTDGRKLRLERVDELVPNSRWQEVRVFAHENGLVLSGRVSPSKTHVFVKKRGIFRLVPVGPCRPVRQSAT